jgi:DNA-binding cell septation regulator SpoVG
MKVSDVFTRESVERLFGNITRSEWDHMGKCEVDVDSDQPIEYQVQQHFDDLVEERFSEDLRMEVTSVRMNAVRNPKVKTIAIGSLVLNGVLVLNGIRVINSEKKGLIVTYPLENNGEKRKEGEKLTNVFYALDDLRDIIYDAVMDEVEKLGIVDS